MLAGPGQMISQPYTAHGLDVPCLCLASVAPFLGYQEDPKHSFLFPTLLTKLTLRLGEALKYAFQDRECIKGTGRSNT